jgi:hypothetical protein
MRKSLVLSWFGALLALGCNNPVVSPVDAGGDGGSVGADGGRDAGHDAAVIADAGNDAFVASDAGGDAPSDAGSDAAAVACSATTCTGAHACVRGTCVLTCGANAAMLETALGTGLTVLSSVCHTPDGIAVVGTHVYEIASSTTGLVTTFTLTRWTLGSETPTVTTVATAMHTATSGTTMTFGGGYVAVSSDEMHAVFGYTTSAAGAIGGVFDVATGSGIATEIASDGNFDAAFLDATHFVVNGAPAAGQGLYRDMVGATTGTRVVSHLGQASGSVALWAEEGLVLAGGLTFSQNWPDGTMGDRVLVFAATAISSATTPIDGDGVQHLMAPSGFELLSGGRIASVHYDSTFAIDAIQARTLTHASGGMVTSSSATNLASGTIFTSVAAAGNDIVLGFTGGLLFVH